MRRRFPANRSPCGHWSSNRNPLPRITLCGGASGGPSKEKSAPKTVAQVLSFGGFCYTGMILRPVGVTSYIGDFAARQAVRGGWTGDDWIFGAQGGRAANPGLPEGQAKCELPLGSC